MSPTQLPSKRTHIVLVPGFGGFDALGQIRYYAGLTPLFLEWVEKHGSAAHATLHYFDNLPTAAVATRAARLRDYLAKRIVRREFQRGDTIVLVGHSTGGLDIRRLLWDLTEKPDEPVALDGLQKDDPGAVRHSHLLEMLQRVVFLSVPQYGTNIANWVSKHDSLRRLMMNAIRDSVAQQPNRPGIFRSGFSQLLGTVGKADLFLAARDAMEECDEEECLKEHTCLTQPRCSQENRCGEAWQRTTASREAYSELRLWTQHIAADFRAITDLEHSGGSRLQSPAQFDAATRARELERWRQYGITTRSYATVGRCPFNPDDLRRGRVLSLIDLRTWPTEDASQKTDVAYRWSYRACAVGPFVASEGLSTATELGKTTRKTLENWENDGIVNTASMLWPDGPATRLVNGDHGDIIGHYRQVPSGSRSGRRFHAYDLLRSDSGFTETVFKDVWHDVLGFCVDQAPASGGQS